MGNPDNICYDGGEDSNHCANNGMTQADCVSFLFTLEFFACERYADASLERGLLRHDNQGWYRMSRID